MLRQAQHGVEARFGGGSWFRYGQQNSLLSKERNYSPANRLQRKLSVGSSASHLRQSALLCHQPVINFVIFG